MISYYDLLGMIKENNIPEKVKYDYTVYEWDNDSYYYDDGYDNIDYLSGDIIFEKDMFDKNIEIIEPKKIEKLKIENDNGTDYYIRNIHGTKCYLTKDGKIMADKINEIIEVLNEKEKIQNNQE